MRKICSTETLYNVLICWL